MIHPDKYVPAIIQRWKGCYPYRLGFAYKKLNHVGFESHWSCHILRASVDTNRFISFINLLITGS